MNLKIFLSIVAAGVLGFGTLSAAEYTVKSAEELTALKTLKAGDVVTFTNGTYDSQKIMLKGEGTADAPVVFKAETPGGVIFTGKTWLKMRGSFVNVEGFHFKDIEWDNLSCIIEMKLNDSRLYNCAITGTNSKTAELKDTKWVSMYGQRNTIEKCHFADKRNIGCLLVVWFEEGIVPAHKIVDNYFTRPHFLLDDRGNKANGQETIRIGTSDYSMNRGDCIVTGNHFYRCDGEIEVISNKSCYNLYSNNLFEECQGAMTIRHGNNTTVENNFFIGNGRENSAGIRVIGDNQIVRGNYFENTTGKYNYAPICMLKGVENSPLNRYFQVKNTEISNNTIVNCVHGIVVGYGGSSDQTLPVIETVVKDNTIVNDNKNNIAVFIVEDTKPDVEWENNTIFGSKLRGIDTKTLPIVKDRPTIADRSPEWKAIKENSGAQWTVK